MTAQPTPIMLPIRRSGLTLIEFIVSLGLIAMLSSLVLVAVHHARSAARAISCVNNSRQMALASISYADLHGRLPTEPLLQPENAGWAIDLLAHIEQATLGSLFDPSQPVDSPINLIAANVHRPATFHCVQTRDEVSQFEVHASQPLRILPNHYLFNAFVLGVPFPTVTQTDTTMLVRDSAITSPLWHSSPFTSTLDDGSPAMHANRTVMAYVSGRAEMRTLRDERFIRLRP